MPSDIEIAQAARLQRISSVAREKLGIAEEHLEPYGHYKAKVSLKYLESLKDRKDGKLVLVTAMTPTPAAPATAAPTTPPPRPSEFRENENLKDIFFDFDKYDIRAGDAKILDGNAAWLKSNNDLVLIEGHCDERGTNEYNLALGERRAKATMNYLVGQGVQANRITIISYGEERPTCTDHSEGCWARNRRSHFLVKAR
jgi:peptidoglycan-associated lipoprotein